MGKEEKRGAADKQHYVLIGYVAICVMMIFATLFLAFTADVPTVQATETATRTRSAVQLTLDADYATIAPTPTRSGS